MPNFKLTLAAAGLLAAVPASSYAQHPRRPVFDKAVVERGRAEFISSCGFCHGNDAAGNRAPDLVRSALVNHDKNGDLIGAVIHQGRPDKGMPAFPLNDQQVADITTFLHFRVQEGLNSAGVPRDYPLAKLLTGNAAAGKEYFDGAGGCAKCHSATGDLSGIAGKYTPLTLQHRILAPQGPKPSAAVTLPDGAKVTGTLVREDEFDIEIRDKDGWHRSWPRSEVRVEINDPLEAHRELMNKYTDADVHNLFAYLETLK